ncbi:MAG: FAD-dependent oxidoreductase [Ruminococcaceae bacterium]|nr:FAD-dependent oxidoreductase [Oscillospiraceae bacterium]
MKYPKLFSPCHIGNVEIPNRVVVTPMGTGLSDAIGNPTPEYIAYVQERAKGGLGLFITEVVGIDEDYGRSAPRQLMATRYEHVNPWRRLADAVHMYGGKLFAQLQHPGRHTNPDFNPTGIAVAPSAITGFKVDIAPRVLTEEEIKGLVKKFAFGAKLLQMAGVDGVDLHGAHRYLIHQFFSPMINDRTDAYGGSFENRMRFVAEIIAEIRETCGPAFPISVRISATEDYPGGYELDEGVRIAQYLEGLGVDAINVSNGIPEVGYKIQEPPTYPEGWKIGNAREIRKHVKIPVIAVSQIRTPSYAESLVADGSTDFVGITRGHLADPAWCNKAKSGNEMDIRPCVSCLYCFAEIVEFKGIRCATNPQAGRELELASPAPTGGGRNVAIIGAGPAGLEAARLFAQRGFKPVVFERTGVLGGMLHAANKLLDKYRIDWLVANLIYQTQKAGVEFRMNTTPSLAELKALDPAMVVVATGSKPIEVPFPGSNGANVHTVTEYLEGNLQFSGKKIAVIGGGTTGCEVAEKLAIEGKNDVTVVEMREDVGLDMFPIPRRDFMFRMDELKIHRMVNTKLETITAKGITCEDLPTGKKAEVPFDAVIMSLGYQPDNNITQMVKDNFDNVRVIGDAVKVRKIAEALYEGHAAAYSLA